MLLGAKDESSHLAASSSICCWLSVVTCNTYRQFKSQFLAPLYPTYEWHCICWTFFNWPQRGWVGLWWWLWWWGEVGSSGDFARRQGSSVRIEPDTRCATDQTDHNGDDHWSMLTMRTATKNAILGGCCTVVLKVGLQINDEPPRICGWTQRGTSQSHTTTLPLGLIRWWWW